MRLQVQEFLPHVVYQIIEVEKIRCLRQVLELGTNLFLKKLLLLMQRVKKALNIEDKTVFKKSSLELFPSFTHVNKYLYN